MFPINKSQEHNNPVIKVDNLNKKYGTNVVLKNINFSVNSKEIICILGASGCGKTTLIRNILGIEKPDTGFVKLFGNKTNTLDTFLRIGYMSQVSSLYEYLSGKQHFQLFGKMYEMKKEKLESRMKYLASLLELEKDLNKKVSQYSTGMKKRLAFAITILHEPELIILDEPTVGIDPILRKQMWMEILNLKNMGRTILVTTHVMDEVKECSRLILLNNAQIIADNSPNNLLEESKSSDIEEMFIHYIKEGE